MNEIAYSTELIIRQPVQVVWRRLTSFDDYPSWNPYQKIEGEAKAGAKVRFSVNWGHVARKSVPARITAFDPPRRLEFTIGWIGFRERRWIELEPVEQGVRVRHGVRFTGWLAQIAFQHQLKTERLKPYYEAWGAALAGRGRSAAPPEDGKPLNRRQRRAARKKAGA
jgi:uncharacterized protein YndB with AHSA1/START domain